LVVTLDGFCGSLAGESPPHGLSVALNALWWAGNEQWDKAHALAQSDSGGDGAWVHAYLHRVEGDLDNARYWYRAARRPVSQTPLEAEWAEIATALLNAQT
jgi:hypothetical protein